MALKLKCFSNPSFLKSMRPSNLISLLEPWRLFLDMTTFSLPHAKNSQIDYLELAAVLGQPTEDMPQDLADSLHLVSVCGKDEYLRDLLPLAQDLTLDIRDDDTAADVATLICIKDPDLLRRKEKELASDSRRAFESYLPSVTSELAATDIPLDLTDLQNELDRHFQSKSKGIGVRIIRKDSEGEVRYFVEHGDTCKREPSRRGTASTSTLYRPERVDTLFIKLSTGELNINATAASDRRYYRTVFGLHLFKDENRFSQTNKYTLGPLRDVGPLSLACRDIDGIDWIRLSEVKYRRHPGRDHTETHRAPDVFHEMALASQSIPAGCIVLRAVFKIKLTGEATLRTATIEAGNKAAYTRGDEAAIVERWLRARGFIYEEANVDSQAVETLARS